MSRRLQQRRDAIAETETGKPIQFSEAVPTIQLRETIRNPFPVIGTLIPSHPGFPFPKGAVSNREAFSHLSLLEETGLD